MDGLEGIAAALDRLRTLIAAMEGGMIVTDKGVDVTAQQIVLLKGIVEYLETVLHRLYATEH